MVITIISSAVPKRRYRLTMRVHQLFTDLRV
jgi:hypothetical protein